MLDEDGDACEGVTLQQSRWPPVRAQRVHKACAHAAQGVEHHVHSVGEALREGERRWDGVLLRGRGRVGARIQERCCGLDDGAEGKGRDAEEPAGTGPVSVLPIADVTRPCCSRDDTGALQDDAVNQCPGFATGVGDGVECARDRSVKL